MTSRATCGDRTAWTRVASPRSPDLLIRKFPMAWMSSALIMKSMLSIVRTMSMYFMFWLGSAV